MFSREKVPHIAQFQQKAYLEGSMTVNFSDSVQQSKVHMGLTHYLARLYPQEVAVPPAALRAAFTEDHCGRWAPALRNLLWFDPAQSGAAWAAADYFLPNANWLVSRHVSAAGSFGFAAKGGRNDEPHNHNDLGHFILTGRGEAFLCDLGSGEYTAQYFGSARYAYDCNGSQGHSVPIVEGQFQTAGAGSAARCLEVRLNEREDVFMLDLTKAYPVPHLSELTRSFRWQKSEKPLLILEDRFTFSREPSTLIKRIVTKLEPVLTAEGLLELTGAPLTKLWVAYDPLQGRISSGFLTGTIPGGTSLGLPWISS